MLFQGPGGILAAAATQAGGAAAADPYGPELITNGGFATDTDWSKDTGVTISGGKLRFATAVAASAAQAIAAIVPDATYRVSFTIDSITLGALSVAVNEGEGTSRNSAGTYSENIVATGEDIDTLAINASVATTCVIDDVSVKLVL